MSVVRLFLFAILCRATSHCMSIFSACRQSARLVMLLVFVYW